MPSANEIDLRVEVDKATCSFQCKLQGGEWEILLGDTDPTVISFTVPDPAQDAKLAEITTAWHEIPDHIKAAILVLAQPGSLPPEIEDFTRLPNGLILLTGPTGSGKTTTMNYMIDLINSEQRCKIIAIEDPVEYIRKQKKAVIVQQELHADVKTFSKALIPCCVKIPTSYAQARCAISRQRKQP